MSALCFICELPIQSHQVWNTWKINLLSPTPVPTSAAAIYTNNVFHEDCLVCLTCSNRLKQHNGTAKRYGNKIYCDIHYADISGIGSGGEEFMNKLRDFKRQSLGCAEARRKSSTTLSFVQSVQGMSTLDHNIPDHNIPYLDWTHSLQLAPGSSNCSGFPHGIKPTSGYWVECKGGTEAPDHKKHPDKPGSRESENHSAATSLMVNVPLTRSNSSADSLYTRKGDRAEFSKSTSEMEPVTLYPPTIQITEPSNRAKDDLELCRKHGPNIVITMAQSMSPPHSPQAPNQPPAQPKSKEPPGDPFELISFQEETYEKHFYGKEHWNYFTNDEALGPVILSLKQETINFRDTFRILLRTVSYCLHGLVPTSSICADRYDREAVVRCLGDEAGLKPNLALGQLPSTPDELLKLDQVFIKSELKVGVVYIKQGQTTEEAILANKIESPAFKEFLDLLGDRIQLKGFDKYKGGLDTVHDLTGTESVYTWHKGVEIMFHVSTMLPHEENDPQKLQKKRHIGNDIVCVAFIESDDTQFWPGCIKSHFLHTFIVVKTSVKPPEPGVPRKYNVSVVCRDEVLAFKPYLWHQSSFENVINGERASYSAPKFARMQDRTRSQMLEDIVTNLANHLQTGQIPKPYRRGSWRPIGHMRPSSPLLDSVRDLFEGYDQLAKDFSSAFYGNAKFMCDVAFNVTGASISGKNGDGVRRVYGVRAILAIRSRVFLEMLYGFGPPGAHANAPVAAPGTPGPSRKQSKDKVDKEKPSNRKRGSITAETMHKIAQIPKMIQSSDKSKRKDSIAATKSPTPTYLTVPGSSNGGRDQQQSSTGIKAAFSRLVSGSWAGWGSKSRADNMKRWQSESIYANVDISGNGVEMPGFSVCADLAKIDRNKLAQTEFTIIEFDGDTFQLLIEYLHSGTCPLTCDAVAGLICAAEHFDLPDLLQACFHHTKTHLRLSVVPKMLNQLENYYWRYTSASQLVNTIFKFVDPRAPKLFYRCEYIALSESMLTSLLSRPTLNLAEGKKFQVMLQWSMNRVRGSTRPAIIADVEAEKILANHAFELQVLMNRLTRDLKLYKIPPQELIKVVLPSKTISHERILATLLYQADSGIYRSSEYSKHDVN
ncbi:Rap1 GTPase-activating protein 1 [Halotydeus destructor]|nr:Rap1 GTPase-activating protein 1 [Halotydeus destructor]